MTWNFRAIKHEKDGEEWIAIHDVYHDKNGKHVAFMVKPVSVVADDEAHLRQTLQYMLTALEMPSLKPEDFSTAFVPEPETDLTHRGLIGQIQTILSHFR